MRAVGGRLGAAAATAVALLAGSGAPAAAKRPPSAFDLPVAPVRFRWTSALAQRNDLNAVRGTTDAARIWAVGATGTVVSLRGANATLEATGTDVDLYDIWVAAPDDVWIVGERGTILHGDGKIWSPVRSGTKRALYTIWGRSAEDLWIGGDEGTVLHREAGTWRAVPAGTKGPIASIAGCERGTICALTLASRLPGIDLSNKPCHDPDGDCPADEAQEPEGDRILRLGPDGRWTAIVPGDGTQPTRFVAAGSALWLNRENKLLSVLRGDKIVRHLPLPKDTDDIWLSGLWASSDRDGWLVGARCTQDWPGQDFRCDAGAIWRSDGRSVSLRKEVPPAPLRAVWAWSKTGAVAVGALGAIVRFDGATWTTVSRPVTDANLRAVWSGGPPGVKDQPAPITLRADEHDDEPRPRTVAVGVPAGRTIAWALPKAVGASALATTRADVGLWLVGDCEALRAGAHGWVTFFPPENCAAGALSHKIFAVEPGDVWMLPDFAWTAGSYAVDRWDGQRWSTMRLASSAAPADISGSRSDDVWIVGGREPVHWDGRSLATAGPLPGMEAADQLVAVWEADANNVWAAAYSAGRARIFRWGGERWLAAALFRLDPPQRGQTTDEWTAQSLWRTTPLDSIQLTLWGTSASDVWLAGPHGIVIRFDGKRWWRVATPTRAPLYGLGGAPDRVIAVGAAGTIIELDRRRARP